MQRRTLLAASCLASLAALAGCATLHSVQADISTFGEWPADRKPGLYAFDRLPSQQAQSENQAALESAAAPALAAAGFRAAGAGETPDVLVQLGHRISRVGPGPWDDPIWWQGSFGAWRHSPWYGPRWGVGMTYSSPRYEREVALLLRDRASGKPLYEARAANEGYAGATGDVLAALYRAAMVDFPRTGPSPRTVRVDLAPPAPAPSPAK